MQGRGTAVRRVRALLDRRRHPEVETPAGPLRVLLVDDCPDERLLTALQLRELGHQVEAVATPDDALLRISRGGWDILLTDVELPLYSGIELARKVREQRLPVRIVFTSGHDAATLRERGAVGAILPKPFDAAQLARALPTGAHEG